MSSKLTIKLAGIGALAFALSGCSHIFKDHSNDYRFETGSSKVLQTPEGSLPPRNDLPIPNASEVPDIDKNVPFVVPRARFVFYPMAKVLVEKSAKSITFDAPASLDQSKKIVKDFLMALHGEGQSIASETDDKIVSVPFQFEHQGWWASLWSSISRNFPQQVVFSFAFSKTEKGSLITIQFKTLENGEDTSDWMSPTAQQNVYADVIRLWGDMGRQLNKSSVYLSERGENAPFKVWIDHRGILALHLNAKSSNGNSLDDLLAQAGLQKVAGKDNVLKVVGATDASQNANNDKQDASAWEKREYTYKIDHQKAGDFLVIDVASLPNPELSSFLLMQHLIK